MAASGKSTRKLIINLLIAAGLVGGGYYYFQRSRAQSKAPEYMTARVARGPIQQTVTATGQLDPLVSVDVGSQISGLVQKLYVDFNSPVAKGQKLAEIDPATYQQRLRQAEANLASTRAANRLQRLNTERTRELFAKSLVSRQDLDQAEAQLAQSEAQLLTSSAAVENARVDLERCTINSPIDGIVISKQTEEGKTVAASLNAPTLFTIANDLAKMQITAAVAESDVGAVEAGQPVTFTVDAFPNRSFSGQLTQVRNAPRTISNVVTYDTIINVDNRDLKLRPGMTANVSIIVASRNDALRIPNAALRVRFPESSGVATAATSPSPSRQTAASDGGERRTREVDGSDEGGRRGPGGLSGSSATPEQREQMRAIMAEAGITSLRDASAAQRERFRKLLAERGLITPPAAPGETAIVTRTAYRLPGGDPKAAPEPVVVRIGITDGSVSEVIDGLAEGDTIVTGVSLAAADSTPAPTVNPFGMRGRRF